MEEDDSDLLQESIPINNGHSKHDPSDFMDFSETDSSEDECDFIKECSLIDHNNSDNNCYVTDDTQMESEGESNHYHSDDDLSDPPCPMVMEDEGFSIDKLLGGRLYIFGYLKLKYWF